MDRKILIVTYYFRPANIVGAKRCIYWFERLQEKGSGWSPRVVTSSDDPAMDDDVICVPCSRSLNSEGKQGTDVGFKWLLPLSKYLFGIRAELKTFDIILFTGNPFGHFLILPFIRLFTSARIVVDYRDPYSNNPLFRIGKFKSQLKQVLEKWWMLGAHAVITVNLHCLSMIPHRRKSLAVIDNGFDERVLQDVHPVNTEISSSKSSTEMYACIDMVYAGKLSYGRSLDALLEVLSEPELLGKFRLTYIGPDGSKLPATHSGLVRDLGCLSYKETLATINAADMAVLPFGGYAFESTTKIFDYIGLKKMTLALSSRDYHFGALMDLSEHTELITFATTTNLVELRNILAKFVLAAKENLDATVTHRVGHHLDTSRYSRSAGYTKLQRFIEYLSC